MPSLAALQAAHSALALTNSASSTSNGLRTSCKVGSVAAPRRHLLHRRGGGGIDANASPSLSLSRSHFSPSFSRLHDSFNSRTTTACSAFASSTTPSPSSSTSVVDAKRALLEAVDGTYRGCVATASERAAVEEAQVALESLGNGGERARRGERLDDLDLNLLAGKWRLVYTTAADVLSVLRLQRSTGLLEVGDVFQSFTADGKIENEIRLSIPFLLAPATQGSDGGVALKVDADYVLVGARTLSLTFQEAKVSEVRISSAVETLLAPALLPRGSLNHQVLLAIRELELRFPLRGAVTSMVAHFTPCVPPHPPPLTVCH